MERDTTDFVDQVKDLAERYDLEISIETVGDNVPIKLWVERACVEITMTAKSCTVIDGEGRSKSFEKPRSGWDPESLRHIEGLLTAYRKLSTR